MSHDLRSLSDKILLEKTEELVRRERELLSEVLYHLREIERRRLFSSLGYKSLFHYATKKLGYADDQAGRRIAAMRLLQELPEIETKIADGSLNLTNMGMAQTLFVQEAKKGGEFSFDREEKLALLEELENKSKRDAEIVVVSNSSEPKKLTRDRVRVVTEEHVEFKFVANSELFQKLEKIRGLVAHSHPNVGMAELVELAFDLAIQKLDPAKKVNRSVKTDKNDSQLTASAPALKRRITAKLRSAVWEKAESKCEQCGSQHSLEVDHIQPIALGGTDDPENLRLLCRSCNQRAAIEKLGEGIMSKYVV